MMNEMRVAVTVTRILVFVFLEESKGNKQIYALGHTYKYNECMGGRRSGAREEIKPENE